MAAEMKGCVVCGQGSTRETWIKKSKDGKHVACDNHSDAEIEKAVSALNPAPAKVETKAVPTPSAPPPEQPNAAAKTAS